MADSTVPSRPCQSGRTSCEEEQRAENLSGELPLFRGPLRGGPGLVPGLVSLQLLDLPADPVLALRIHQLGHPDAEGISCAPRI